MKRLRVFLVCAVLAIGCSEEPTAPATGSMQVSLTTTGDELDPDGYRLSVHATEIVTGLTASLPIPALPAGTYLVRLNGLASNCRTVQPNPQTVTVVANRTVNVEFTVVCVLTRGSIKVRTVTTGGAPDPDGYTVFVNFPAGAPALANIGVNDSTVITQVAVGTFPIQLSGLARNCIPAEPRRSVAVRPGQTTEVTFRIVCDGGDLRIVAATSGIDIDLSGFSAHIVSELFDTTTTVATLGKRTVAGLAAVEYTVSLSQIAPQCLVVGPNPRKVRVINGATADADFQVICGRANSRLAFVSGHEGNDEIYVMDVGDPAPARATFIPTDDANPAWSPDGQRIAFTGTHHGNQEIYVSNIDGSNLVRITEHVGVDDRATWSPDGERIAFQSQRDGSEEIYTVKADGSDLRQLTDNTTYDGQPSWSAHNKIAFIGTSELGHREVFSMDADGSNRLKLTNTAEEENKPAWSSDGSRIAFSRWVNCASGMCRSDIFVMNADGSAPARVTTFAGSPPINSYDPSWSFDGRRIAFTGQYCAYLYYYEWNCSPRYTAIVNVDGTGLINVLTNSGWSASWR